MAATHCCASHGRGRPRHRRFAYFARFAAVSQMARRRDAFTGFALQGTPSADYSPSPSALLARSVGKKRYSKSNSLLICADAGGSNGYRSHLWKKELQEFCDAEKIKISVCHFPPGTSKWNKIEHRLFSFISMNWRGKPLLTYQTIISLISSTKTKTGLTVKARLDKKIYKKGIKVSKDEMNLLNIVGDKFHGEWNYSVKPRK